MRLRVLDLTDDLAPSAGRLLLGLGADVVRIAAPAQPLDAADIAADVHWHAGKQIVTAEEPDERSAIAQQIAARADVVIESGSVRDLAGVDLSGAAPRSLWPDVVHVVVTPFGLTGPRRDWRASDLVLTSAGGMAYLGGHPAAQPKPPPGEQAGQLAGAHAAIGALLAVLMADRTGEGQLVDISAQEAVAATLETAAITWIHAGRFPKRTSGVYEHVAHRIFAARDGYVAGGYSGSPRMWSDLLAWLVDESAGQDLTDKRWSDPAIRWRGRAHVDDVIARFVAARPAEAVAAEGRRRALPWAEVVASAEVRRNPHLLDRKFFVTVEDDRLPEGAAEDVGFAVTSRAWPCPVRLDGPRTVPLDRVWNTTPRARRRPDEPAAAGTRPLDGMRVLDLTWVLAGPYATKTLADFGADVIKVESVHRGDPTRNAPGMRLRPRAGSDDSGYFINFNRNKRSIALNLRQPAGADLLRRIAGRCDVVIENFSPGVLDRWGLTYEHLATGNPSIIVVSMAGTGQNGPWRDAVTFADTLAAMSGLSWETRDPGGPPQGLTFGLGDMVAANAAIVAVLDRLHQREGGHVDVAQLEAMVTALGPAVLAPQLGVPPAPATTARPNRHRRWCPHGLYPAAGDDRWLAITITDEVMWRSLADACPSLRPWRDTAPGTRRTDEDTIDQLLDEWVSAHDATALAARLQAAGVAAALVNTGADLVDHDEQLAARGFYAVAEHPLAGRVRHEGIVERLSLGAGRIETSAPLLGEHTDAVLRELGGLDDEQIAALRAKGILE
jgi:crotonobetainyl-CoA:carnitine CoA-transferase CaiB-like acyl-CoA transferase